MSIQQIVISHTPLPILSEFIDLLQQSVSIRESFVSQQNVLVNVVQCEVAVDGPDLVAQSLKIERTGLFFFTFLVCSLLQSSPAIQIVSIHYHQRHSLVASLALALRSEPGLLHITVTHLLEQ